MSKPDLPSESQSQDKIQFKQYKMLLQAGQLTTPESFQTFWKIVKTTAKKFDIGIKMSPNAFESQVREILFFDTADFDLYKNHFIVRLRTPYKNGWACSTPELTVKFRHPEFEEAAKINVLPKTSVGVARIKFKEEFLPLRETLGGMRPIYSHNCILAMPRVDLALTVQTLRTYFPDIKRAKADKDAPVIMVNDNPVTEIQDNIGKLDFGHGVKAKTTVSIWRNRQSGQSICGEYAFQIKFDDEKDVHPEGLARADAFYKQLQLDAYAWVTLNTTKTSLVYEFEKNTSATH
ncbi:hypothetical protein [Ruficoccus sp. ZRK36]|uniref:hypothetical protein n=1 Tax=Ruficoccus sp. ZRK36 TaxID=2866311 RepID=UPI001C73651C|nr:hypothetical protein [Ruficoccus sp. ZRK36]QYY34692.1 hypothetical protein K0V07_10295 [Ruficoccus sp. ZRK36]